MTRYLTDADMAALRPMQAPVISAIDGACHCGHEYAPGQRFANPDPSCGVGTHRLNAQKEAIR